MGFSGSAEYDALLGIAFRDRDAEYVRGIWSRSMTPWASRSERRTAWGAYLLAESGP